MGLFSLIGSFLGGNSEKKAINKATDQQVAAFNRGIDEQARQFDTTQANFAPYREIGGKGLSGLGDLIGVNGGAPQQSAIDQLLASPYYQSLYRNGEEALLQNASATGGLRGGNTQRSLADFGADTLNQTIQQQLASLGGLAGMGMGATESVANFGQNKANAVTQLLSNIGGAQASGSLAKGGINNQMWNNAGGFLDSVVSAFMPGGGGMGAALKSAFSGGF
jgi:hypothetical protein